MNVVNGNNDPHHEARYGAEGSKVKVKLAQSITAATKDNLAVSGMGDKANSLSVEPKLKHVTPRHSSV